MAQFVAFLATQWQMCLACFCYALFPAYRTEQSHRVDIQCMMWVCGCAYGWTVQWSMHLISFYYLWLLFTTRQIPFIAGSTTLSLFFNTFIVGSPLHVVCTWARCANKNRWLEKACLNLRWIILRVTIKFCLANGTYFAHFLSKNFWPAFDHSFMKKGYGAMAS